MSNQRKYYIGYFVLVFFCVFLCVEFSLNLLFKGVIMQEQVHEEYSCFNKYNAYEYKERLAARLQCAGLKEYIWPQNLIIASKLRAKQLYVDKKKKRIVFLGDSVLHGSYCKKNEIYTTFIQKKFSKLNVINLGIPGANIYQIHSIASEYMQKLQPEVVVYMLNENDLAPNICCFFRESFKKKKRYDWFQVSYLYNTQGQAVHFKKPLSCKIYRKLSRFAAFRYFIIYVYSCLYKKHDSSKFERYYTVLLQDIYKIVKNQGAIFYVVVNDDLRKNQKIILETRKVCDHIFILPELDRTCYVKDGHHLNKKGHRITAYQLIRCLLFYCK